MLKERRHAQDVLEQGAQARPGVALLLCHRLQGLEEVWVCGQNVPVHLQGAAGGDGEQWRTASKGALR